jgi:hypothetical protein
LNNFYSFPNEETELLLKKKMDTQKHCSSKKEIQIDEKLKNIAFE